MAVTLLAFLSVALVGGLALRHPHLGQGRNLGRRYHRRACGDKRVALDLARVYPQLLVVNATDSFIDFTGTPQRMEFLSTTDRPDGQMTRIALSAANDDRGVAMQYDTLPELTRTNAAGTQEMLLRHLRSIEFRILRRERGRKDAHVAFDVAA